MKHIKYGKCSHISIENTDNKLIIYTKGRINKANVHRYELKHLSVMCAAWGDEDKNVHIGLENFGVDVDGLKMSTAPKRYLC